MIASLQNYPDNLPKPSAAEKERNLRSLMLEMRNVLVAYSGGVDSSYLALIATETLGPNARCLMGLSPSVSNRQRVDAAEFAARFGLNFETVRTDELENAEYVANPNNRCYFCKTELYGTLSRLARDRGVDYVLDGANADDVADYRPGRTAATENEVRSPLVEVGLTKAEIRQLSKDHGLPTWDRPASPCLSSRIAYGVPVTIQRLGKVEAGEEFLYELGFREFRVRVHGDLARIEISPTELPNALNLDVADRLSAKFKEIGFKYVTLDLDGFRSGAMNEAIDT